MKVQLALLAFTCSVLLMLAMCSKSELEEGEDKILFEMAKATSSYTWYKDNDAKLASTQVNAHNWQVRVRFNVTAQNALGSDGKLPIGAAFPSGSLIVKESYDENGGFMVYAVMYKRPNGTNTYGGWQWAEYNADGKAVHSISKDNTGCINCHNDSGNRDFVMFFDRFP